MFNDGVVDCCRRDFSGDSEETTPLVDVGYPERFGVEEAVMFMVVRSVVTNAIMEVA
jgi:hypothetical protein